ncbi:MAG TPA: DUF2071 domain-containing protein [Candidatus Angelobacter sp.]|nr:DUF2071 domain-containing protein [Candidatus Angelobacter sp.]
MHRLLLQTGHRPIPMPSGPWIMKQNWHDLLFAHWEVSPQQLRPLVPMPLELDFFEGRAYVAVAPFHMSGIRARFLPPVPGTSRFPELNVRTYVHYKGISGVYFFSLDAANRPAVWGARTAYNLPYFYAEMSSQQAENGIVYRSKRLDGPYRAEFRGRYWPVSDPVRRLPGSLEHFLTERYCLYAFRGRQLRRASIHHLPWPLQDAAAEIDLNTMAEAAGITLPASKPLLHFSRFLEVLIWPPSAC